MSNPSSFELEGLLVNGVIFDFDGVLADSLPSHLAAWDEACRMFFSHPLSERQRQHIVGRSTKFISKFLAEEFRSGHLIDDLKNKKVDIVMDNYQSVKLFDGVGEVFSLLNARKIPFGIASNAPAKFIRNILSYEKLKPPIVFGLGDTVRPKPAPDPFLACARAIGLKELHSTTVVFEDSPHGIGAANSAGMIAVGVSSQLDEKKLRECGAKLVFPSVADALLEKL